MIGFEEKYIDILTSTNALKRNNDPNEAHPKSSRSPKWVNLLKPIWTKYSRSGEHTHGNARQHIGSSIQSNRGHAEQVGYSRAPNILPSDPLAL
jgi:hypothetical protein